MEIEINKIRTSKNNPRKNFRAIEELAEDIKKNGLIHNILVKSVGDCFEIVQGERRFRALQLLRRDKVDCEVRELTEEQANDIRLSENIQREDLSVIELANEFQKRLEKTTQQQLAKQIGKSQPYIVKVLKFLELPKFAQVDLECGIINKEQALELLRFKKYLKMLCYDDDLIKSNIDGTIDMICFNPDVKKKLRHIIDLNIVNKIRYELKEKGEEHIIHLDGEKDITIIKKVEQIKITDENSELLRFVITMPMKWCNHEWVNEHYDFDTGDCVSCEEYCEKCGKARYPKIENAEEKIK